MKNVMKEAHKMTKEIKIEYPEVNYKFQLGLCISYLSKNKGDVEMVELKGSEKQVIWAEKIRNFVAIEILEAIEKNTFEEKQLDKVESVKKDMNNDSAVWWIETFGFKCVDYDNARPIVNYLNNKPSRKTMSMIMRQINNKYGY